MKKILLLAAVAAICSPAFAQKTVNVATAGTLGSLLTETEQKELTQLKVTGELNSADVKILRAMTKTKKYRFQPGLEGFGVLEDLDLSGATFIRDSKPYFSDDDNMEDYGTAPNQIGGYMFFSSMTLKRFVAPAGTTSVGAGAFQDCETLVNFVSDPISVFGASAFSSCKNLEPLSLEAVRSIGSSAFQKNLKITSVDLSDDVKSFSGNAFSGCENLKSVKIGKSIKSLDSYSFNNLPALETVELSENIEEIYPNSFNNLPSLKTFTCHAGVPPTTPNLQYATGPFDQIPATAVLYVPEVSMPSYKAAKYWKSFQEVKSIESVGVGIVSIGGENNAPAEYFTLQGVRVDNPIEGIYVVRQGSKTSKVIIK